VFFVGDFWAAKGLKSDEKCQVARELCTGKKRQRYEKRQRDDTMALQMRTLAKVPRVFSDRADSALSVFSLRSNSLRSFYP